MAQPIVKHAAEPAALLRALLAATTADQLTVPRQTLAAVLAVLPEDSPALGPVDLTVPEVAQRFGRAPSTIRQWLEQGRVPQAYRLAGKEWRIPATALEALRATPPAPPRAAGEVDLSAWRRIPRAQE